MIIIVEIYRAGMMPLYDKYMFFIISFGDHPLWFR